MARDEAARTTLGVWEIPVIVEWHVTETDLQVLAEGDTEADFGRRALERVREALETIRGDGKALAHYTLRIDQLRRCSG